MPIIHRSNVSKYDGTLQELAEDIGNLKYDALSDFLQLLAVKMGQDGGKDEARGRRQLAAALRDCSAHLTEAAAHSNEAWRICEPYMTDKSGDELP